MAVNSLGKTMFEALEDFLEAREDYLEWKELNPSPEHEVWIDSFPAETRFEKAKEHYIETIDKEVERILAMNKGVDNE